MTEESYIDPYTEAYKLVKEFKRFNPSKETNNFSLENKLSEKLNIPFKDAIELIKKACENIEHENSPTPELKTADTLDKPLYTNNILSSSENKTSTTSNNTKEVSKDHFPPLPTKRIDIVLCLILKYNTRKALMDYTNYSKSSIERITNKLLKEGLIENIGENNSHQYKLTDTGIQVISHFNTRVFFDSKKCNSNKTSTTSNNTKEASIDPFPAKFMQVGNDYNGCWIRAHKVVFQFPIFRSTNLLEHQLKEENYILYSPPGQHRYNKKFAYATIQFGFGISTGKKYIRITLNEIRALTPDEAQDLANNLVKDILDSLEEKFNIIIGKPSKCYVNPLKKRYMHSGTFKGAHVACVNHPIAQKAKELGYTYDSSKLGVDCSIGLAELETKGINSFENMNIIMSFFEDLLINPNIFQEIKTLKEEIKSLKEGRI